jgi:2-polyprenyl-3-methyl-5-hydroxy-6-metoxy-1,4-benzoquinol methylase
MNQTTFDYAGNELDVFQYALNWKHYWKSKIKRYLGRSVLEVGVGIGGTTRVLCSGDFDRWLGIDPDAAMIADLQSRQAAGEFPAICAFQAGIVGDLPADARFDSILYIDVLEHIADDRSELKTAVVHLNPGGYLIVLSPAFQKLYTEFDRAIGHYRRYTRNTLAAITPSGCEIVSARYLDMVGTLLSLGNRLLLRSPNPSYSQIQFWDRWIVPVSRIIDPMIGYSVGRSVVFVWRRTDE